MTRNLSQVKKPRPKCPECKHYLTYGCDHNDLTDEQIKVINNANKLLECKNCGSIYEDVTQ